MHHYSCGYGAYWEILVAFEENVKKCVGTAKRNSVIYQLRIALAKTKDVTASVCNRHLMIKKATLDLVGKSFYKNTFHQSNVWIEE